MNDLYGVRSGDAASVAASIGERLGPAFHERDSEYLGAYWMAGVGDSKIKVVPQPDPVGELLEPSFPDHPVIIYVDGDTPVEGLEGLVSPGGVVERLR